MLRRFVTETELEGVENLVSGGFLDSFTILTLIADIEGEFSISIDFDEDVFSKFESLESLIELVETELGKEPSR